MFLLLTTIILKMLDIIFYLGVNFSITGSLTEAKNVLYKKGLKVFFLKIWRCFEHHKPKIKTILHVFDHTVKPVLL